MKLHIIKHPDPNPSTPKRLLVLDDYLNAQYLPLARITDFDPVSAAKEGFHIVSVAALSLTHFSAVCEFGFGISHEEQERLIQPILSKQETGTLFPKYRLTILPYRYHTTRIRLGGEHDYTAGKGFTIEEVETHIRDAFRAESEYIRSGRILFDFRDFGDDMLRYRNTLVRLLSTEYAHNDWMCYLYSCDNSEFIDQTNAEQDGGGQPATRPESK